MGKVKEWIVQSDLRMRVAIFLIYLGAVVFSLSLLALAGVIWLKMWIIIRH